MTLLTFIESVLKTVEDISTDNNLLSDALLFETFGEKHNFHCLHLSNFLLENLQVYKREKKFDNLALHPEECSVRKP